MYLKENGVWGLLLWCPARKESRTNDKLTEFMANRNHDLFFPLAVRSRFKERLGDVVVPKRSKVTAPGKRREITTHGSSSQ